MNTKTTAVVRALEASIPVYDVRDADERGHSTLVTLVDGRGFFVDAPFEGDVVVQAGRCHTEGSFEGALAFLEDLDAELTEAGFDVRLVVCRRTLDCELRVRDDVGGWAR